MTSGKKEIIRIQKEYRDFLILKEKQKEKRSFFQLCKLVGTDFVHSLKMLGRDFKQKTIVVWDFLGGIPGDFTNSVKRGAIFIANSLYNIGKNTIFYGVNFITKITKGSISLIISRPYTSAVTIVVISGVAYVLYRYNVAKRLGLGHIWGGIKSIWWKLRGVKSRYFPHNSVSTDYFDYNYTTE